MILFVIFVVSMSIYSNTCNYKFILILSSERIFLILFMIILYTENWYTNQNLIYKSKYSKYTKQDMKKK